MKLDKISFLIFFTNFILSLCFDDPNKDTESIVCENVEIIPTSKDDLIPSSFQFNAKCGQQSFNFNFIKSNLMHSSVQGVNVYIHDDEEKLVKESDETNTLEYFYTDNEKESTSLLIETNPNKYKITSNIDGKQVIISPISDSMDYEMFINENNIHIDKNDNDNDNETKNKHKRAASNNAIIEVMVILDYTILNKYSLIFPNQSLYTLTKNMYLVYSHIINQVNIKFQNSFQNDSDLNINVQLTHILILPNVKDTPWSNPNITANPNNPTNDRGYGVRETIYVPLAYTYLISQMNLLKLPFQFDLAVAFTDKEFNYDSSSYIFAYGNAFTYSKNVCGNNKYILMGDLGVYNILALSFGYSLGASTDGSSDALTCPLSNNFIMSNFYGQTNVNLKNLNYFSSCSIQAIKNFIISNQQTSASCLFKTSKIYDSSLKVDKTLPGTIWNHNTQCKISFGSKSYACFYADSLCFALYCYRVKNNDCIGFLGDLAFDGTSCGLNKICFRSQCINNTLGQYYN